MRIRKPACFDSFRCIAGACPDSCCKEWEVQVDPEAAEIYRNLPGALGEDLRNVLREEDGEAYMTVREGKCPMWRTDGLYRIQAELGEEYLCHTCREFPRLTHDYGEFAERGLELSCPEAAWLILSGDASPVWEEGPGGEAPEYDTEAMASLLESRETALALLSEDRPMGERLSFLLLWGYQAQEELDGAEKKPFDPAAALELTLELGIAADVGKILAFYRELELLDPAWGQRLTVPTGKAWDPRTQALARYFVERYWLQAVSDYDLACRVKFMVVSCLVVSALGGDFVTTAQRYSKEIENNADNVDALLDAAYSHPAFTDDKVLGLLMGL